ncbi:MAG: GNAT family N-acetyltransferase [Victivallaceae bacterium]|nr:GNAT family N-acetyltransferase [Victivallaceae bacterium]
MLKDRLMTDLDEIVAFGARAPGSLDELRAAEYIEERLDVLDLDEVKLVSFPSASHLAVDSTLKVIDSGEKFISFPTLFSPQGDVSGELVFIGSCHASHTAGDVDLSGKIGMLTPTGSFQERIDFILDLERRGLEGLIVVSPALDMINTKIIRYPEIKRLPSISVSWHTACQLKKAAGQQFSLIVNHQAEARHESVNVIGKINGKSDNWLLISAHIDTAPYSVGANDNASGVAVLLEHVRQIAAGEQPEATIYFLFSGSEEYGALDCCGAGAKAFYRQEKLELSTCIAHLEIDDVGDLLFHNRINIGGSRKFIDYIKTIDTPVLFQLIEKYRPSCDHGSAIYHGIPFICCGNKAPEVPVYHTPGDELEFVDPDMLVNTFKLTEKIIEMLCAVQPFFPYLKNGERLIRPAYYRDFDAIKAITRLAFEPVSLDRMAEKFFTTQMGDKDWFEYKNRSLEDQCRANIYNVIVCEIAGNVVGYATMSLDCERGIAEVGNNAVHPDFQGKGIGKMMQQEIMRRMIESGFEKFKVNTLSNDIAAQKVYEKLGFEKIITGIYYLK